MRKEELISEVIEKIEQSQCIELVDDESVLAGQLTLHDLIDYWNELLM